MDWTADQVDEMRVGRPTYGEREQSGALTWLRTVQEAGGEYNLLYAEVGSGYQVFPHYHTLYTETFKLLEGGVEGRAGNQRISPGVGDEVAIPPRMVHGWSGGNAGFEKWVIMLPNMAVYGLTIPDLRSINFVHAALVLVESDTNLPGSARVLNPVVKAVAWLGCKAGVDRRLEEKYFHRTTGEVAAG